MMIAEWVYSATWWVGVDRDVGEPRSRGAFAVLARVQGAGDAADGGHLGGACGRMVSDVVVVDDYVGDP